MSFALGEFLQFARRSRKNSVLKVVMRRIRLLSRSSLLIALVGGLATACSSSDGTDPTDPVDAGFNEDATIDAGPEIPDSGPADAGFEPCNFDKGGLMNRGCEPGFVCNLKMDPPQCVQGKTCQSNADCDPCSDLQDPQECGHGYALTAWCDSSHGNVCVRSKAPCEPCETDADCGFSHPFLGFQQLECIDYGNNESFCSRPRAFGAGCPRGFEDDGSGRCVRAQGCAEQPFICPENLDPTPDCAGTGQICPGEECPNTGGAECSTNDLPGALGTCIGFCQSDEDCPPQLPTCNPDNGICGAGCAPGTCPAGQVCHLNGFCAMPCADNTDCENDVRYGPNTYCNSSAPIQPPPRFFKAYHDTSSCQALGCERAVDCGGAGRVCDPAPNPPQCVDGCFTTDDCRFGEVCKDAPPPPLNTSYSREQCRAFPNVDENNTTLIGTCCNPGCLDRDNGCPALGSWCCGEPGSPYEDPDTCLTITATGGRQAQPGECFPMLSTMSPAGTQQWCSLCIDPGIPTAGGLFPAGSNAAQDCTNGDRALLNGPDDVTATWYPGFATSSQVNNGMPFRNTEFCTPLAFDMANGVFVGFCGTTCNPDGEDTGCPRPSICGQKTAPCCQNSDCGGLECIGAACNNPDAPAVGQCSCGQNGMQSAACPTSFTLIDAPVPTVRCEESQTSSISGTMVCVVGYNCTVNTDGYPDACFEQ